jgi:hypothetical protein
VCMVVKEDGPVYPNFGAARQGQKRKRGGDSSDLVESDQSVGVLVYSFCVDVPYTVVLI